MRVLLDTCVLSELNKQNPAPSVVAIINSLTDQDLYTSVICIGEIKKGVELLSDSKRKSSLKSWLMSLEKNYSNRILPVDLETVKIWGELTANAQKNGHIISATDGLIAATGIQNSLKVMTRNVKDFQFSGALIINPWD